MEPDPASLRSSLASLSPEQIGALLASLSDKDAAALNYDWELWARPEQLPPPGEWLVWLALAGRGWGKTQTGAEFIRDRVKRGAKSIALIAETQKDLEEVMVPRIIAVHPPWEQPKAKFRPVRLTWPNGATAYGYNGTEPDQLRGPEFDTAWADELAKYRYAQEAWDMLQFTMRRPDPRIFVSTTPRPIKLIRDIIANPRTVVTKGRTLDNARNLDPNFIDEIVKKYGGTRLGRQELDAEILDDVPGALWSRALIDETRRRDYPDLRRVVVAIDPPVTSGENADECGIIAAGVDANEEGWVIGDHSSQGDKPSEWARRAVRAYELHDADCIVAEVNNGGEMIGEIIRQIDASIPVKQVRATRGKFTRAEPISALYEQRRVHHVGSYPKLEDQMCSFTPDFDKDKAGYSPDRLDAMVWAFTELMTGPRSEPRIRRL